MNGRLALLGGIALLLAFVVAPSAHAAPATVVYPTGQFPTDVQNVQAALDQGGTVLLKATNAAGIATAFNFGTPVFGPDRWVEVDKDVELVGERTSSGATTIQGGWFPVDGSFHSGLNAVAVRDIDFQSSLNGAILLQRVASVEVTGNRIFDVVGAFSFFQRLTFGETIVVSGGRVVISDNVVEGIDADRGAGITEFGSTGPVEISRNHVSGTSVGAIESSGPRTEDGTTIRIEENVVRPGSAPTGGSAKGIVANGIGAYRILRNDVVVESTGEAIAAVGSLFFGPVRNPVIAFNHVVLVKPAGTTGTGGITLGGRVSGAYVGQNRIEGDGLEAIALYRLFNHPNDLGFNTLVGNNIAGFRAEGSDVFLDAPSHDTVLVGASGSVIDLGTNNRITGFTDTAAGGAGAQVSEAVRLRNAAAESAADRALDTPFNRVFEAQL
jgi:hypothetical protein